MKTIKLHYRVKNYIYPFRVVVVIFDTQRVNPQQVQEQFLKIFSTLTLSPEQTKLFSTFTTYQKLRFCIEHKKVLETRKDFIGATQEERMRYFESKLMSEEPKRATEYRKYLMEIGTKEKEKFFPKHFDLILEKLESDRIDMLQMIDCIHVMQTYVQEQSLINMLESYTSRIIKTVLGKIQHQNLQIKRRGFKIISQLCSYYENAYPHLFQAGESSKQLDHIFKQVDTQNLILMRIVLKFVVHLMYCATKKSNFMLVIVECIETQLLHKLYVLKTKLRDKSYKIYESFDEFTNLNELQSNTLALRIQKISVERDTEFIGLKQQIIGLIDNIEKRFNELEQGKHKPQVQITHHRQQLKKKYEKKQQEEYFDIIQEKVEAKHHPKPAINPNIHKRARKRSSESQFMRKAKYLDKMPPTSKQMTIEIVQGYQYKLLEAQNEYDKYKNDIEKVLWERDKEIERLNKINKDLLERVKKLEQDLRKSRKGSFDLMQSDLFSKTQPSSMQSLRKSIKNFTIDEIKVQSEQFQQASANRVRNITKIFQISKHLHQSGQPVLPPPPPPPSLTQVTSTLPPPPPSLDSLGLPPPPPILLPPPLLSTGPKINPNRKPKIQIKTPMKILSWNILQLPDIKGSVWENMEDVDVSKSQIEQLFAQADLSPTSKTVRRLPAFQIKASFLNSDRARMIELILLKLKLNILTINETMYKLDEHILTYQTVMSLLSILPQQAQITLYKSKQLQYSKLSISDQFYYRICNITGYQVKLRSLKFKSYFDQSIYEYLEKLKYFSNFFKDLKEDKIFHIILKYALSIGNIINSNSVSRQGAYGFKLQSLEKLSQITTIDNKQTLLEFIIRLIRKEHPHLLKSQLFYFYGNYQSVAISSKVMVSDFGDFTKNLGYVKRALTEINEDEGDISSQFFFKFYRQSKQKLDNIQVDLREAEKIFGQCQQFYLDNSESEKIMSSIIALRSKIKKELANKHD